MKTYLARLAQQGHRIWVIFDNTGIILRGHKGEAKLTLVSRWLKNGNKGKKVTPYKACFRPSELAMEIADLKHESATT